MRLVRRLSFLALFAALLAAVGPAAADTPKQKAKKAALEAAKKAAAAKKAPDVKPAPTPKSAPSDDATPPLKPAKLADVPAFIDKQIAAALAADKLTASPTCTDAEFLRRVHLDLAGTVPTADAARSFLDDTSPDKRAKLIDQLLAAPTFGRRQADVWHGLLVERSSDNRRVDFASFRTWLADQFNQNRPWNALVADVITASGPQDKNPAVGFFLSNNLIDKMTDESTKVFLGLQLQCAQCHNHPFTSWKQTEYWETAAFYANVRVNIGKDRTPTVGESTVTRNKKNELPESAKILPPKFPQGAAVKSGEPLRPALAKWMTGPTNPFFARAMVNRVWHQLFAVGLVNPVDDMHGQNLPTHPELLDGLAADFAANGFDVKGLYRNICTSAAYQRSSKPTGGNDSADATTYARGPLKVLTPEQLFDSLDTAVHLSRGVPAKGKDKQAKGYQPAARDRFAEFFLAGAEQPNTKEYEAGIPQALRLMNARQVINPNSVREVVGTKRGAEAIESLYLATLSRRPTAAEAKRAEAHVSGSAAVDGYADLLWALVNCSEFTLNR